MWLNTCYVAYNSTGYMYEKYNAFNGLAGGGGEYTGQTGFGWTNGVALILINSTYQEYVVPPVPDSDNDNNDDGNSELSTILASVLTIFFALCLGSAAYFYFYRAGKGRRPSGRANMSTDAQVLQVPMAKAEYTTNNPMV
jgi:Na+/proline symporter